MKKVHMVLKNTKLEVMDSLTVRLLAMCYIEKQVATTGQNNHNFPNLTTLNTC